MSETPMTNSNAAGQDAAAAHATAAQATPAAQAGTQSRDAGKAKAVAMPPLSDEARAESGAEARNMDVILDIPVTISMEIGRSKVPIRSLLQLNQGSVVELDRMAGEPLDVMVNGTLIAHGEVVVVNERYGIRFTDVVSPAERVQKLK